VKRLDRKQLAVLRDLRQVRSASVGGRSGPPGTETARGPPRRGPLPHPGSSLPRVRLAKRWVIGVLVAVMAAPAIAPTTSQSGPPPLSQLPRGVVSLNNLIARPAASPRDGCCSYMVAVG
jgi:hypothetical protein